MNTKVRDAQLEILNVFSKEAKSFALAGGTALELYYLHHRFSADLDFFSPVYDSKEIDELVLSFSKFVKTKIKFESEFIAGGRAKVKFYNMTVSGSKRPLKMDFVEDVIFANPDIKNFNGVRVYSVENMYLQKIMTITGTRLGEDEMGREVIRGRQEARDVFDIYMLSGKIRPLHIFLKKIPQQQQRGMIHWYRTFSRQELKLALLDLDIYDKKFNAKEMIIYLEDEIKQFTKEAIE